MQLPANAQLVITAANSLSALGVNFETIATPAHLGPGQQAEPCRRLPQAQHQRLKDLQRQNKAYRPQDPAVLQLLACLNALPPRGGLTQPGTGLVCVGSSRGATAAWEQHYQQHIQKRQGKISPFASPMTTPGNLASALLQAAEAEHTWAMDTSMTCISSLSAMANAVAWLSAGMAQRALVGGTEAPLTGFTLRQLKSAGVLASPGHPCRPFHKNSGGMALGEGAALFLLEPGKQHQQRNVLAELKGIGLASENAPHPAAISAKGEAFFLAMQRALAGHSPTSVDLILAHAPGTPAGDAAELQAIARFFGDRTPPVASTKQLLGHTLGASAALSLAYALGLLSAAEPLQSAMLRALCWQHAPPPPGNLKNVLINAAGFGGVAGSIFISSPLT